MPRIEGLTLVPHLLGNHCGNPPTANPKLALVHWLDSVVSFQDAPFRSARHPVSRAEAWGLLSY
jgi:hypothetical protein